MTAVADGTQDRRPLLDWAWGLVRLDFVGVAFGALFFCLSLTPSLLPREWQFAGLIGGINVAIGYGIGVFVGTLFHRFVLRGRTWWPPGNRVLWRLKAATVAASITACVLMIAPAAAWQRQVSALMGMEGPATPGYYRALVVALVVGGVLVGVSRVVLDAIRALARVLIRRWHVNDEVALFIGTAVVVALILTLINGVLFRGFLAGASRVFQPQNTTTRAGVEQPMAPERSGSPASFAPWDTLGYQGRNFVGTGPDADELTRINGKPAKEPVRVYAGLQTADTDAGRISVLLTELERTHAFDRKVLVIVPTTGTGWVNPVAAARAGDDVQRRHRHGGLAIFVSAQLDFVRRRHREVEGFRPHAHRRRARAMGATAAGPSAKALALRRKPGFVGGPVGVRVPAGYLAAAIRLRAVGRPAQRQSIVAGADPAA